MIESLVNQFATMTLAEEVHTVLFTAFIVGGAVCCFRRPDMRQPSRPTTSSGSGKTEKVA